MSRIRVECVRLEQLADFAAAHANGRYGLIPISRTRARAWEGNPAARPEDVVLLVARDEGLCVGYVGLLPARVRVHGHEERVFWLTSLYVPRAHREDGIGALLLLRACALGRTLAATGGGETAVSLCRALDFVEVGPARHHELEDGVGKLLCNRVDAENDRVQEVADQRAGRFVLEVVEEVQEEEADPEPRQVSQVLA